MGRRVPISLLVALVATIGTAVAEPGVTPNTILIGQAAGFTGSVAGSVKEQTAGAQAYFDLVNTKGGVHGRKIVLHSVDDGFDPKRTPGVTRSLIEEKGVFALFLYRGTPTTEAAYPLIEQHQVPLIAPSTGAQSMYSPPRKYLFPVRSSYHAEAARMVSQLVGTGIKDVAVLYADDSFGKDGLTGIENAMRRYDIKPLVTASYPRGTTKVDGAVKLISASSAQAVIMVASIDSGPAFIHRMKKAGSTAMFLTFSNVSSNAFIEGLGQDRHGVVISQVTPSPLSRSTPVSAEFHKAIDGRKDLAPSYASMEGFIAAKVLVEAIRKAGTAPTRVKLVAALESMRRFDLGGVDVTYGPQDRTGSSYVDLTIVSASGKLIR